MSFQQPPETLISVNKINTRQPSVAFYIYFSIIPQLSLNRQLFHGLLSLGSKRLNHTLIGRFYRQDDKKKLTFGIQLWFRKMSQLTFFISTNVFNRTSSNLYTQLALALTITYICRHSYNILIFIRITTINWRLVIHTHSNIFLNPQNWLL